MTEGNGFKSWKREIGAGEINEMEDTRMELAVLVRNEAKVRNERKG